MAENREQENNNYEQETENNFNQDNNISSNQDKSAVWAIVSSLVVFAIVILGWVFLIMEYKTNEIKQEVAHQNMLQFGGQANQEIVEELFTSEEFQDMMHQQLEAELQQLQWMWGWMMPGGEGQEQMMPEWEEEALQEMLQEWGEEWWEMEEMLQEWMEEWWEWDDVQEIEIQPPEEMEDEDVEMEDEAEVEE